MGAKVRNRGQSSVISDSLVYLSYHNIDSRYAFALANQLIRYYRNLWLDRLEIAPMDDWRGMTDAALEAATQAVVIVSDDWLECAYCRREYAALRERQAPIIAVVARDFSAAQIGDIEFEDWVDCRRFFADPGEANLAALLSQIPEARHGKAAGDRAEYLRGFIAATELQLGKMAPAFAALMRTPGQHATEWRTRGYPAALLRDWAFGVDGAAAEADLLDWAERQGRFIFRGAAGQGVALFARMLALQRAHDALRDPKSALPVWLDLGLWDAAQASLDAFIESQWQMISYWKHWLGGNRALFLLDGWDDLVERAPAATADISRWIESETRQDFVILSEAKRMPDPEIPALAARRLTATAAQKFASACLPIAKASDFRHLLRPRMAFVGRNPLDYLAIGIEFMAADRALAANQWRRDPMPALIGRRLARLRHVSASVDKDGLTGFLRRLAWTMLESERHRLIYRRQAAGSVGDEALVDAALEIGILTAHGDMLRFASPVYQWHLAGGFISGRNLAAYLGAPRFVRGERLPTKWDGVIALVADKTADDERAQVIDAIAEVDPFLAHACARRQGHDADLQERLVQRLIELCAGEKDARPALLDCLADMADLAAALSVLTREMSRYDQHAQLWLWGVCLALPVDMPLEFVELVKGAKRDSASPAVAQLSGYSLSLAVAFLVKLARNDDAKIRSNAIWMLGEIKYLPTAALLLDWLEKEAAADVGEIALALMKYAYSDILSRLLRFSQTSAEALAATRTALGLRGRLVTSRLLKLASEGELELHAQCYDLMVDRDETDIALGLAGLVAEVVELPASLKQEMDERVDADALRRLVADSIKHLPSRERFAQLVADIETVLANPPESTVIAGSGLGALLYGNQRLDDLRAAAEAEDSMAPPDDGVPDELERRAKGGDLAGRVAAIKRLAEYTPELALPHLLDLTGDPEASARMAAHEVLFGFSSDATARKAIIAALSDPAREVVDAAADWLKRMPELEHGDLLDLLESENARTATAAIDVLRVAGYQPALHALERLLDDDRRGDADAEVIGSLARKAIAAIESAAGTAGQDGAAQPAPTPEPDRSFSDEDKIRRALEVLRDDDWGRTQKAAQFLRKFARHLRDKGDRRALPLFLAALNDDSWHARWAVAEALAWFGDGAAAEALAERLDDSNWIVQVAVIRSLAALKTTVGMERLMALLRGRRKQVREAAAEALGELGYAPAMSALGERARIDEDAFVRLAALNALHAINPTLSRPHLIAALDDDFIHVRWQAMRYLAPLAIAADVALLSRHLSDEGKPEWEARSIAQLAAAALRRVDTAESRAALAAHPRAKA